MSGIMSATALGYTALGMSVLGAVGTAVSSYSQGAAQQNAARQQATQAMMQGMMENESAQFQANVANMNAEMAEDEGKEAKKIGYDNAQKARLQAAQVVGEQRSAMAASGAQVDQGAFLDLALDTAEKGELDALALNEQGLWADYNKRMEGANFRANATGARTAGGMALAKGNAQSSLFNAQANSYSPWLSAGTSLIGGLGSALGTYGLMNAKGGGGHPDAGKNQRNSWYKW